ncbi:RNA-directed DNA polymerase, eukaryota, reverse transcriptase zinc-binding domain protein, partial [Tanacetum coccineum]
MSNKKRQSKRKPKLPSKFNDHVMNSMSQNRKDFNGIDDMDEIRVTIDDKIEEIGENCNVRNRTVIEGAVEDVCDSDSDNEIVLESDGQKMGELSKEDNKGVFGWGDKVLIQLRRIKVGIMAWIMLNLWEMQVTMETLQEGIMINSNKLSKNDVEKETDADKQSKNVSSLNSSPSEVDAVNDCTIGNTMFGNSFVKSYAKTVEKKELNKNLYCIPTSKKDNGDEVVVFDEEIVEEGSKKWLNTVCGYFVGCNMSPGELRYNIRRMWSKYGLYDIISNGNSVWLFKFRNKEGMNTIVNQSPLMVNGKPLMVQKWNPDVCVEKDKISIWAKLYNIPLEAWSVKGILVEMDASKGFKDTIEIQYKDKSNTVIRTKFVKVEFSWKPVSCSQCKVFGHNDSKCYKNGIKKNQMGANKEAKLNQDTEGFVEVKHRKQGMKGNTKPPGKEQDKESIAGTRKDEGNAKVQYKYIPK